MSMRLAPPSDLALDRFGEIVTERLGLPFAGGIRPGDRAIHLSGSAVARRPAGVIGGAVLALRQLEAVEVSAVQLRVERWEHDAEGGAK
jgi:hypothetical protein